MRKGFFVLGIICCLLFIAPVQAAWWVIDIDNNIVAKCNYEPDAVDLGSRNETAIWTEDDIVFDEAEYRGSKIVKHVKTQAEKDADKIKEEKESEEALINERMKKIAMDELIAEGVEFKHVD